MNRRYTFVLRNLIDTPIKIPASHLVDNDKLILKFIWRGHRPRLANTILKEKNNWKTDTTQHQLVLYSTKIKKVWYWQKNRQERQWTRI